MCFKSKREPARILCIFSFLALAGGLFLIFFLNMPQEGHNAFDFYTFADKDILKDLGEIRKIGGMLLQATSTMMVLIGFTGFCAVCCDNKKWAHCLGFCLFPTWTIMIFLGSLLSYFQTQIGPSYNKYCAVGLIEYQDYVC